MSSRRGEVPTYGAADLFARLGLAAVDVLKLDCETCEWGLDWAWFSRRKGAHEMGSAVEDCDYQTRLGHNVSVKKAILLIMMRKNSSTHLPYPFRLSFCF